MMSEEGPEDEVEIRKEQLQHRENARVELIKENEEAGLWPEQSDKHGPDTIY